jgi:hypothetical protein
LVLSVRGMVSRACFIVSLLLAAADRHLLSGVSK